MQNPYHKYAKTFHYVLVFAGGLAVMMTPSLAVTDPDLAKLIGGFGGLLGGAAAIPEVSKQVKKWLAAGGIGALSSVAAMVAMMPPSPKTHIAEALLCALAGLKGGACLPQPGSRPSIAPPAPVPVPVPVESSPPQSTGQLGREPGNAP